MIKKEHIGNFKEKDIFLFSLVNKDNNVLKLSNYGARVVWIEVPDIYGNKENICFGYDTCDEMLDGDPYFGSTIGRYANRIAKGSFILDGETYFLSLNDGENTLHGGNNGWHSVVWEAEINHTTPTPSVKFTYDSPDMEEGYPGNIHIEVSYTWTNDNELIINYSASTDKKTVLNVTNHAYFNLCGADKNDVLNHIVQINAAEFIPVDSQLIPTGEIQSVKGTAFDFTHPQFIKERITEREQQLINCNGYDHTFVLNKKDSFDVRVYDPESGRTLEINTDEPGVHFYTGNFLDGSQIGYGGVPYSFRSGFCMETGHFPDSPNHANFPETVIYPSKTFNSKTIYKFSVSI